MDDPQGEPSPVGVAYQWVGRIMAVVAEMVVPGVLGRMLDDRWGTSYLVLIGFAGGLSLGMWHLIAMTRPRPKG